MSITISQKKEKINFNNFFSQKPITKRQIMKKILNHEIKIVHSLEEQIVRKKAFKCYVHGSNRKFSPKSNQSPLLQKFTSQRVKQNKNLQIRFGVQAPSVTGTKKLWFQNEQNFRTRNRSKTIDQQHRFNMRSCCNLRGSSHLYRSNTDDAANIIRMRKSHDKITENFQSTVLKSQTLFKDATILESSNEFVRTKLSQTSINFRLKKSSFY